MTRLGKLPLSIVVVLAQVGVLVVVAVDAHAARRERWVATWSTAQLLAEPRPASVPPGGSSLPIGASPSAAPGEQPPPAPPAPAPPPTTPPPPVPPPTAPPAQPTPPTAPPARRVMVAPSFSNQTVRMIVRSSVGGRRARLKFANAFGAAPVDIGAARLALRARASEIVPGSDRALSFGGNRGCTIRPGQVILSDPVDIAVAPLTDLAVSVYLPRATGPATLHYNSLHATYVSKPDAGDVTAQASLEDGSTTDHYYYLAAVDVLAADDAALVVAFGDSITDGARSTPEANASWPSRLAARLQASKRTARFAVANLGISGNRVLRDGSGVSALARFDRDVLGQSGVKWLMLLEGINDIGMLGRIPAEAPAKDDLIAAYRQLIERAHAAGIKVIGCTLLPFEGAMYYREPGEAIRSAVNQWIRSSGAFDAVVDFDAALRDPASPRRLRPAFDPGDHLHPNDAGYAAMADAIDLGVFGRR